MGMFVYNSVYVRMLLYVARVIYRANLHVMYGVRVYVL